MTSSAARKESNKAYMRSDAGKAIRKLVNERHRAKRKLNALIDPMAGVRPVIEAMNNWR